MIRLHDSANHSLHLAKDTRVQTLTQAYLPAERELGFLFDRMRDSGGEHQVTFRQLYALVAGGLRC